MKTTSDLEELVDRFAALEDAGPYVQMNYPLTGKTAWRIEEAGSEVELVELEREAIRTVAELNEASRLGTYAAGLLRRRATDSMGNWMPGKTWDELDWRWLAIELAGARPVFRSQPSDEDVQWLRGTTSQSAAEIGAKALRRLMPRASASGGTAEDDPAIRPIAVAKLVGAMNAGANAAIGKDIPDSTLERWGFKGATIPAHLAQSALEWVSERAEKVYRELAANVLEALSRGDFD